MFAAARLLCILGCAALAACGLPKDPNGTLDHVRGGVLHAGLPAGPEQEFEQARDHLADFAASLNAELDLHTGETHRLVEELERGELDLVGPLPKSTPFKKTGFSNPYGPKDARRVWAVRAGENAFLLTVNERLVRSAPQ